MNTSRSEPQGMGGSATDVSTISVLVVDDHQIVRLGLIAVLNDNPQLKVVGEASNGIEALSKCSEFNPHVVLLDVRMPGESGIEACRKIKQYHPHIRVLFLTSYADSGTLIEALTAGADGYVLKAITGQDIADAVEKVGRGMAIVDPSITRQVLDLAKAKPSEKGSQHPALQLTAREHRMMELVTAGCTNKEIATTISIADKTVRNTLSSAFRKLGATSRKEAATLWKGEPPPT